MADGTQQNPLRDMITALGSLSEMAHIFYTVSYTHLTLPTNSLV